jgi:hypothetical protein
VANGHVVTQAVSRWPVSSEALEKVTLQFVALLLDDAVLGQVFFPVSLRLSLLHFPLATFIPQMVHGRRHEDLVD